MLDRLILIASLFSGQAGTEPAREPADPSTAERIRVAEAHIRRCEGTLPETAGEERKPLERIDHPLMTYGDPARANDNGTLWAWGLTGRPRCFLELYQSGNNRREWIHAITLTSTDLVRVMAPEGNQWTPQSHAWKPVPVEDVPVGGSERMQLRQMKEIAGRLAGHEFWDPDNSRYELRLLVQPVHRYSDPGKELLDGTTFVLAHGTNPEILVFIEAAGPAPEKAQWQIAAARLGSAELHLRLGDREIWTVPRTPNIVGRPSDPYWLFWSRAESQETPVPTPVPRGTKEGAAGERPR